MVIFSDEYNIAQLRQTAHKIANNSNKQFFYFLEEEEQEINRKQQTFQEQHQVINCFYQQRIWTRKKPPK